MSSRPPPGIPRPGAERARSGASAEGADLAVNAHGLVKTFGTNRAVDGIDLSVAEGEIFGILGPNGAGKTVTLRMLATLLPIDGGEARIFGYDVRTQPHAVRQLIGVTGQYASVDEDLTGRENLWLFGRLQGLSSRQAHRTADDLLEKFHLTEAADRPLSRYSGGMRRRLDLATSLITKRALVFLDEPTTGLDPRTRGQMWETIRDLVADGCTILLTTQYVDEADELADRIALFDRGRKVAEGTPGELKAQVGTSSLRVQLADRVVARAAAALAAVVAHAPPDVAPAGTGFTVALSDASQATDVLIALRQHNIDIANVTIEKPSLDEVFMTLTGHPSGTPTWGPETSEA